MLPAVGLGLGGAGAFKFCSGASVKLAARGKALGDNAKDIAGTSQQFTDLLHSPAVVCPTPMLYKTVRGAHSFVTGSPEQRQSDEVGFWSA
jgi:hypothetical protein